MSVYISFAAICLSERGVSSLTLSDVNISRSALAVNDWMGYAELLYIAVFSDGEVFVLLWRMLPETYQSMSYLEMKQVIEASEAAISDIQVIFTHDRS